MSLADDLLERTYAGNTLRDYVVALGLTCVIVLAVYLSTRVVRRRIREAAARTATGLDDLLVDVLGATRVSLTTIVAIWIGAQALVVPAHRLLQLERAALIALFLQIGFWGGAAIHGTAARLRERKVKNGELASISVIGMMTLLARVVCWIVVALLILDNLNIDITALVAGLGIGGIAIALAAQNILGDLFASISIIFDKPFTVGEFIVVGDLSGTVEQIGLKTTRVRSISGEELIMPNGDLLGSRIRNFKRMSERRIVVKLGVTYGTRTEQLAELPAAMRRAVEVEAEEARFDRAHFSGFGDSALMFELVYYVTRPDYAVFMDVNQRISMRLLEDLDARGVEIAFPSQTIYLRQEGGGEPAVPAAVSSRA